MEFEIIPEVRRGSFHSEDIEVSNAETIGQAVRRDYPDVISKKPASGKKFIITVVITGVEVEA